MARRKRTSLADDVMALIAMLPWWAGLAMAVASYLLLHSVATQQFTAPAQPAQMGSMLSQSMWKAAAAVFQYVLPLLCIAGAAMSAWRSHERKTLIDNVVQSKAARVLDGMSWRQFEQLVGEAFRLRGFAVAETGGGGADGGIDLTLTKGSEKFLVQCKQWKAFKVGVDVVRELYGVMAAKGAAGGFVVTSGSFTGDATRFADGRNIQLINGTALHELIQQATNSKHLGGVGNHVEARTSPTPTCPVCSKLMVMRTARRGANAGREFWGCSDYPVCRGTRAAR